MSVALQFSIAAIPATLRVAGGREIPLSGRSFCCAMGRHPGGRGRPARPTLSEERGLVHDATGGSGRAVAAASIPPGGELHWDLYDVLLAAHAGIASKVHLWGYKAVLNWWINFSAWAEYREEGVEAPIQTGISRLETVLEHHGERRRKR